MTHHGYVSAHHSLLRPKNLLRFSENINNSKISKTIFEEMLVIGAIYGLRKGENKKDVVDPFLLSYISHEDILRTKITQVAAEPFFFRMSSKKLVDILYYLVKHNVFTMLSEDL